MVTQNESQNERKIRSGGLGGERSPLKSAVLQIPRRGGVINIEYREMSADLSWPTEMSAQKVLQILRRTMHIKSNSVSLYFSGTSKHIARQLHELSDLTQSSLDKLETVALDDETSSDGIIWQRGFGEERHLVEVRVEELSEARLAASFLETGVPLLRERSDKMALNVIKKIQEI